MATLTPEIAQDLIWRSMVTGVPTTEFEKYGGSEAINAMYKAGGGEYSHDAIPVDLRNQLGQQVAQTGVGNLSILEKTGNALSAAAIENMAKQGTIGSLPLFMERGIPIAESAMPTAQRYISMLPALTGTLQPTAKPTQPTQQPSLLPPAFSGSGLSIPSAYPSQAQTLDFLSPTGTTTQSPQLPVSTLPGYTFSPITTPTVSSIVPSAVPQPQAPVDTQLPSIQQSVQDQFQQRVFGVPRSDIEQFIASRSPQPRVPEYSPMLTPTVSRQQLEQLNRLYGIPQTPPQDDNMQFFREGGAVKKFADGGPSSGVRRLEMSGYQAGGEVTDEMFVGTRPEDFPETSPVDKKAGELLRALSEGTRGFVGAEPIEPGSEAYRTGQALANMPAVGVVAGTVKGAGKAKDALKALTKKDIKLIASELETSRGQLAELAKKYPQLRDASVADIEALTGGEPFTAFRGISLLPGRELRKESTPSMTVDPSVALGMLKDAPVMITKEGFITATPVLRQYPGMKASETQVYVPSLIEQITERQPGALEMKIPTRSGEKMTVADVFKEVKGEKELLADVSKKEPRDILFDRYQGGVGDRYLMEVARRVLAGKWDGGEALLKEIGGYQTDPKGLVQEFDSFAELVKESALKKSKGGEVTDDEFIQEMMTGTAPSEESQQTTGEYIKGLYKENIPVHARVYLETLLGKKDPVTAEDFTKEELARIDSLIQKTEAERLGKILKRQADLQSSLERTTKRLSPQKDIAKKMVEDPDWIAYSELNKKPTSPEVANEQFDAWTRFYNKFADQAFVHEDITLIMGDRDPKKVQSYLDEKKQKNKQTTEYLKDRLSKVNQALDAVQGKGLKGAVDDYSAYGSTSPKEMEDTDISRTLGRFNYETLPSGRRVVKDTYDFYNEYRAPMVEEYEKMGPAKKALSVLLEAVKDPVQLPSAVGNAYIGRDGRPVKVEYDPKDLPVKRQDGSPSQGEISDDMFVGTRPSDFPETSPVDTAVSDFVSSRSKLVTDPQEFFRVMGQNIEEYHSKPLREDPQKYLTEQLGPGALAGTVGKTAKQLFSSLPSSEAPFVGRLDEFVSSLPGAVQKDQFLNQLKGKFRDYDIGRAQEALADLPGNAKLTPFDLLNRVKRVYDPTTFTTKIDLPKAEDDYHAGTDNPFQTKKGFSQKPLGVIHLLQGVNPTTSPDAAKLMAAYDDITNRLPGTTSYSFDKTDRNPVSLAQDIYKIANRAGLSSVEDLGMDVQTVLQNMSQSGSDWSKLISAKTILGNPGRYPLEIKEALDETARITGTLPEENIRSLKKIAEEINVRRTTNQDYSDLESQYHSSFPYAFVEDLEKANRRLWNEHRKGKQQIEGLLEGLQKREGIKARVYRGQHSSLAEDSSTIRDPIAFSRFTEHTTDIPGLGKVDGIYVNELQSDRLDDIRTKGRMGGGPQEDITRLDKLDKQVGEAAKQLADYKSAMGFRFMNESDIATVSEFNSKLEGLSNKRNTLLGRIREGEYSLKESFAGMEESPQVIQQLMAKNAVAGAMQLGKRFVAFPGAESAQAQLYEKLPNNLKQVVKDLGPGFELRPITLPKPDTSAGGEGGELTSYAIVWGDEAADRIKKQGVPFKDGGEVSTEDFIKRFSKGGATEDESWKDEMFVGTRPSDEATRPGILPPELREAIDVPLDLANLAIRGTVGAVAGPAYGLYKGITGGKYGTREGVTEARSEAERMMGEITGEPKTQAAKDIMQSLGETMEAAKIPPMPQFLTTPVPGPGAAAALMRSYELAETPPVGTLKLAGDKGVKPATPPTDQMGFYSPAEKAVMGLPQDKGTASQMLAQITKTQGVKPVELRATGLEDYLKGKGNEPVTKQEIQDFLTNNRVQVDEVVLGRGLSMSPEAKRLMEDAEKRMMKADQVMAPFFEQQEAGSLLQGQEPYSTFYRIRGPLSRKIAKGDQEALAELDALNLPPDIRQAVLDFGSAKLDYQKHSKPARFEQKPKFDGYNTSGGTNAREIYLTLPGEQMPSSSPPSVNAQGVLVKPMYATQPKFTAPSPHSVSPEADANRLAHIFLDERKDAKGNNVLFVQEMQSDWAQQGRDKGFAIVDKLPEGYSVKQDLIVSGQPWGVVNKNGQFVTAGFHRSKEDAVAEVIQRLNTYKLPTAPFVTNTEDWVNLALEARDQGSGGQ
jgi:hypothetical protein